MKKIRMQQKYDLEANWITADPILLEGEIAFTTDVTPVAFKIGDGVTVWTSLPYFEADPRYTNLIPTTAEVGGIPAGSTFVDQSTQEMWDALLYSDVYPVFTDFDTVSIDEFVEVGYTIPTGNKTWTWVTANDSLFKPNSIQISGPGFTTLTGLANDKSEVINSTSTVQLVATGSQVWEIQAENDVTSALFTRDKITSWQWRMYWGNSANTSLTEAQIKALTSNVLDNNFIGEFSFNATGYKYFVYPVEYGIATSFIDAATSFPVAMNPYTTISITNTYGISTTYNIHRTTNPIVSSLDIIVS